MKSLMQYSLPTWARSVFCGLTASVLFLGCTSGPKWLTRNETPNKPDITKQAAKQTEKSRNDDRFAVASRTKDTTENKKEKAGFFSRIWRRDNGNAAKKTETKTAEKQREYQPFETTILAGRLKGDAHPATRDPFLAEEQQKQAAANSVGRVHLGSDDSDNRSNTRTVSRTVIKDEKQTNDNPFELLEHKPTRSLTPPSQPAATAKQNQFAAGFDSRLDNLSKSVPQRPIATHDGSAKPSSDADPFDIIKRRNNATPEAKPQPKPDIVAKQVRNLEAAPFPTFGKPASRPAKTEMPKPDDDPFRAITKRTEEPKPTGANLEAILKDSKTRVDEHGRMTVGTIPTEPQQPVVEKGQSITKNVTIPDVTPPTRDPKSSPNQLSSGDRKMIVDSERIPVVQDAREFARKSVEPKFETKPVQKPIEIQIIPRQQPSRPVYRRDIPLNDVTNDNSAELRSVIMQATASRVLETPNTQSGRLMVWRTHPDAKSHARPIDVVDGFVSVESAKEKSVSDIPPGAFPAANGPVIADEPPMEAENVFAATPGETEDAADGKPASKMPLMIFLGLLTIAATAIAIRRRRSLQG